MTHNINSVGHSSSYLSGASFKANKINRSNIHDELHLSEVSKKRKSMESQVSASEL